MRFLPTNWKLNAKHVQKYFAQDTSKHNELKLRLCLLYSSWTIIILNHSFLKSFTFKIQCPTFHGHISSFNLNQLFYNHFHLLMLILGKWYSYSKQTCKYFPSLLDFFFQFTTACLVSKAFFPLSSSTWQCKSNFTEWWPTFPFLSWKIQRKKGS